MRLNLWKIDMRSTTRALAIITLTFTCGYTYAGGPDLNELVQKNNTMWLGAYGGAGNTAYEFESAYNNIATGSSLTYDGTMDQSKYIGGLDAGYQIQLSRILAVGLEFDAGWMGGSTTASTHIDDAIAVDNQPIDINSQLKLNRVFELTINPAFIVSQSTQLFAKLGAAFGSINDQITSVSNISGRTLLSNNKNYNATGLILGTGLNFKIASHLSTFVEYNYIYFGNVSFNTTLHIGGSSANDSFSSSANISDNLVKLGLQTNIDF